MREKERCFPEVRCRVRALRNGGILLSHFQTESDFAVAKSMAWDSPVKDGEPPFGGVSSVKPKKLDNPSELVRTVRIVVEEDSRATWVRQRLQKENYRNCVVTEVGNPFGRKSRGTGKRMRAMKLVMSNRKDVARIVREGVYLGGRPTIATPWKMYRAALLCSRCQRRNCSRSTCNAKQPRCATCAGPHETRKCKANFTECCWCHQAHPSTSVYCPARLDFLRRLAHKHGFPLPRYAKFVSQPVISSNFDGRSYSNVGAQSQHRASTRPSNVSDIQPPRSDTSQSRPIEQRACEGNQQSFTHPPGQPAAGQQLHSRLRAQIPSAHQQQQQPEMRTQLGNHNNHAPQLSAPRDRAQVPRVDLTHDPLEESLKSLSAEMHEIRLQNKRLTSTLQKVLKGLAECVTLISSAAQESSVAEQSQKTSTSKHPRLSPAKVVGNIRRRGRTGASRTPNGAKSSPKTSGSSLQSRRSPDESKDSQGGHVGGPTTELAEKLQKVLSLVASFDQNG